MRYNHENKIERHAARLALFRLRESSRIAIGVGITVKGLVKTCLITSTKNILRVGAGLEKAGFIAISRPHMIKIIFPDAEIDYQQLETILATILRQEIKKIR